MLRHTLVVFFALAAIAVTGCNTEQMWINTNQPQAPVTSRIAPEGITVPDIQIVDVREVDIVENVLTYRAQYAKTLALLRDYYEEKGYHTKRKWAEAELHDLQRVKPFKYILSAEVPVSSLRPTESIAQADEMYEKGLKLMRDGGHGVPALYRQDLMREALAVFVEMITKYPASDKIDDAAFCCGEILKEYFKDQEQMAVRWYERAKQWNPNTPHPALFNSAVVYDFRLHDRATALEFYHRVLAEESVNKLNSAFATRRIHELTKGMSDFDTSAVSDTRLPEAAGDEVGPEQMVPVVDLGAPDATE